MLKNLSPNVLAFWQSYLAEQDDPKEAEARFLETFRVGDSEASANHGAQLILSGKKTATSCLLWEFEAANTPAPKVGNLSILLDGNDNPACVVETIEADIRGFDTADAAFARDYGEWDGTLSTWQEKNWAYNCRLCETLGKEPRRDMPMVFERFRVVYPVST